jgi:hypothetical protein
MADNTNIGILEKIKKLRDDIAALQNKEKELTEAESENLTKMETKLSKLVTIQEKRLKAALGTKQAQLDLNAAISAQASELNSISSIYKGLTTSQTQSLKVAQSSLVSVQQGLLADETKKEILNSTLTSVTELQGLQQKLAESGPDDLEVQQSIRDAYNSQLNGIKETITAKQTLGEITNEEADALLVMVNSQEQSLQIAEKYATVSADTKDYLQSQIDVYKGIGKTLRGVLNTAKILTSGPGGFFGGLAIGAGVFAEKLGETRAQLGGISEMGTTALAFFDDNAVENAKELANQFGGINNVSAELQASTSLISANMGISGTEAAGLLGSFSRLNGNSEEAALNLTKSTQEFAKQNGIIPSQLMADLAGSAEEFALFGKEGGKNLIEAGAAARKMGVSLSTMTGISENLLDFESSITKELELGAMLGKNINLDRARSLAYQGDIAGATKETLAALGGVDAFNKMDYFQKKATADLLGTSVDELQKMVTQQENANTIGGQLNEKFSLMGETLDAGLNKYLGTSLKSLGGMIMAGAQLGGSFAQMGVDVKGIAQGTGGFLKNLVSAPFKKIGSLFGGGAAAGAGALGDNKVKVPDGPDVGKKGGLMDSMSKIKMSEVLKGAAAMLVVAAAVFVFGKAVQEFMKVSWEAVGMAVVSMLALVGAVALLGAIMTSGVGAVAILAGAAAMLVIAASVLVLGYALQAIGTGFQMMSAGIGTLVPNLTMVGEAIMGMVTFIPAIAALSLALMGLSASLIAVGAAGVIALPGLLAVAAVGAIATGVGSLLGVGGEEAGGEGAKMDELITEIKALREDLNAGKIAVYMDGSKVTSGITKVVSKVSSNSYGG